MNYKTAIGIKKIANQLLSIKQKSALNKQAGIGSWWTKNVTEPLADTSVFKRIGNYLAGTEDHNNRLINNYGKMIGKERTRRLAESDLADARYYHNKANAINGQSELDRELQRKSRTHASLALERAKNEVNSWRKGYTFLNPNNALVKWGRRYIDPDLKALLPTPDAGNAAVKDLIKAGYLTGKPLPKVPSNFMMSYTNAGLDKPETAFNSMK